MRFFKELMLFSLLLFFFFMSGCREGEKVTSLFFAFDMNLLKEGDLVFRRGAGVASQMVLMADTSGEFSHIGIVVKEMGQWKVVHAVPGEPDFSGDPDRVKMESLSDFFDPKKAVRGAVMRVKGDSIRSIHAAQHAIRLFKKHILFDHSYNNKDSTELYCSELVYYVYDCEEVDLVEDRISWINVPGLKGYYILPSSIRESTYLEWIYGF